MITTRTFVLALVLCAFLSSTFTYILVRSGDQAERNEPKVLAQKAIVNTNCKVDVLRLPNRDINELTSPILLTDLACSSEEYDSLRIGLAEYLNAERKAGVIQQASVYLKSMNSGKWFEINGNAMYNPGSMMKIAILMAYLKESEARPELLNEEFLLATKISEEIPQIRTSPPLEVGKKYKVKQLLEEMIINSDNDATNLLNQHINEKMFTQVMGDLGSRTPSITDPNFEMSVLEYNRYFRVLYNSTYLTEEHSNYSLNLLSKSNYRGAIVKDIPTNIKVAHKFGERPYQYGFNFHEAGLFYIKGDPYLLVVMTRGQDNTKLPSVISNVSRRCFEFMKAS